MRTFCGKIITFAIKKFPDIIYIQEQTPVSFRDLSPLQTIDYALANAKDTDWAEFAAFNRPETHSTEHYSHLYYLQIGFADLIIRKRVILESQKPINKSI